MKNIVIPFESESIGKLLLDLAKRLGLKPRIETRKEMEWDFMPDDDKVLQEMMDRAERNFANGKFLTSDEVKNVVRKWK